MKLQITDKRKHKKKETVKSLSLSTKRKTKEQKSYDAATKKISSEGITASNIKSIIDIYKKNEENV